MKKNITKKIAAIALAITSVTTTVIMPASADWSTTPFEFKTGTYTYQDYAREQKVYDVSVSEGDWYPEILFSSFEEYKYYMEKDNGKPIPLLMSYGLHYSNFTKKPYDYSFLTKREQNLYDNIMKQVNKGAKEIKIANGVSTKELQKVMNLISDYGCGASFEYFESTRKLSVFYYELDNEYIEFAEKIRETMPENATEYETVKAINDFMCKNYYYGDSGYENENYYYKADSLICGEYADVFKQLCRYFNLNCVYIRGNNHAWNKVEIDGNWYNVDVCWNDTSGNRYKYFLISDSKLAKLDTTTAHNEVGDNNPKCPKSYSR